MINLKKITCDSKSFEFINKADYLELEEKANSSFKAAEKLVLDLNDYENASVLLFRAIQLYANSLLVKNTGLKSKGKNCQFLELYNKKILSDDDMDEISFLASLRNDIYYMNRNGQNPDYENYVNKCKKLIKIIIEK